jgi:hypothetical protein
MYFFLSFSTPPTFIYFLFVLLFFSKKMNLGHNPGMSYDIIDKKF